jgi:hypothetical protein
MMNLTKGDQMRQGESSPTRRKIAIGTPSGLFMESIGDMKLGFRLNYGDKIASRAAEAAGLRTSVVRPEGVK